MSDHPHLHIAEITPGMIGFARERTFVSRVIRWLTRQRWSHTFIVTPRRTGTSDYEIIEADYGGVVKTSLSKYRKTKATVELCLVRDVDVENGMKVAETKLGRSYGLWQVISFIPVMLLRRLGFDTKNRYTKGIICSELVCMYLNGATGDSNWLRIKDDTTPGDMYNIIHGLPETACFHLEGKL